MKRIRALKILAQAITNYRVGRPLVVSFEVTYSCTANCRHCDKGGPDDGAKRITPNMYAEWMHTLQPVVVQISGGEPLTRPDVADVVQTIRRANSFTYIIFVTNGSLLTEKKYHFLKEAGVDRFSVSLDFPDERHDVFRRLPGLYARLSDTIPRLAKLKRCDIAINSAITHDNLRCLLDLANQSDAWGVDISYSAYSILRTGDMSHFISDPDDLELLRQTIEELIAFKQKRGRILNDDETLRRTYQFFRDGAIQNCKAGLRFIVVRPDGLLNACSMYPEKQYHTQKEVLERFTAHNTCGQCYVAIRAYTDKSFWELLKENISSYRTLSS